MTDAVQGPVLAPDIADGGQNIPAIGIRIPNVSTKLDPSAVKSAILEAIELGYRHVQTSISRHLEHNKAIAEAIVKAFERGLVTSREQLFITSKLEYDADAGFDSVIQDLKLSLGNLHLEFVDLYLIEWPGCAKKPGEDEPQRLNDEILSSDLMQLWAVMEECLRLGLTKSIGVCNFTSKMLENLLNHAEVPPRVNQVEMHSLLREKELREFCMANNISIVASSTIGKKEKNLNFTQFMESEFLHNTAKYGQMTADQVLFRWAYEQAGASLLLESSSKEHMQEILEISGWRLSQDD